MKALTLLGALALLLVACGPSFDHLDFEARTAPPAPVTLTGSAVRIPAGIAVAVDTVAWAGGERLEDAVVRLTSSDPGVLGVDPAYPDGFVIYGVSPGATTIGLEVDGEIERGIPATVVSE